MDIFHTRKSTDRFHFKPRQKSYQQERFSGVSEVGNWVLGIEQWD